MKFAAALALSLFLIACDGSDPEPAPLDDSATFTPLEPVLLTRVSPDHELTGNLILANAYETPPPVIATKAGRVLEVADYLGLWSGWHMWTFSRPGCDYGICRLEQPGFLPEEIDGCRDALIVWRRIE